MEPKHVLTELGRLVPADTADKEFKILPIDALLSAAFMTYLANRDENERELRLHEWRQLTGHSKFSFTRFMTSESQILKNKSEGLPGDDLSIQNSLIIMQLSHPLLIDPNVAASTWLISHLKDQPLVQTNMNSQSIAN